MDSKKKINRSNLGGFEHVTINRSGRGVKFFSNIAEDLIKALIEVFRFGQNTDGNVTCYMFRNPNVPFYRDSFGLSDKSMEALSIFIASVNGQLAEAAKTSANCDKYFETSHATSGFNKIYAPYHSLTMIGGSQLHNFANLSGGLPPINVNRIYEDIHFGIQKGSGFYRAGEVSNLSERLTRSVEKTKNIKDADKPNIYAKIKHVTAGMSELVRLREAIPALFDAPEGHEFDYDKLMRLGQLVMDKTRRLQKRIENLYEIESVLNQM